MIADNGIKLQGKVKRDAVVRNTEYNGVTYYVDRYSYVRLSGKTTSPIKWRRNTITPR